jgi:excinuclease ABC subunit A
MTELTDHIRLLFAKIGQLHCQQCGRPVQRSHAGSIVTSLLQHAAGQAIMIAFPYTRTGSQTSEGIRVELQRLGFRLLVAGGWRLDTEAPLPGPDALRVLVDRIVAQADRRARLLDSLEQALRFGQGMVVVHFRIGNAEIQPAPAQSRVQYHPTINMDLGHSDRKTLEQGH